MSWTWASPDKRDWSREQLLDFIEAAHGIICNAHAARVDDVTEADGASPGWAEAARAWIDAYPPSAAVPAPITAEDVMAADRAWNAQSLDFNHPQPGPCITWAAFLAEHLNVRADHARDRADERDGT